MKRRLIFLLVGLALAIAMACVGGSPSARAGVAAYRDIMMGKPRYYIVSGPPSPVPKQFPVLPELAANRIEPIFTGCISSEEHEAYNAVIARHFELTQP